MRDANFWIERLKLGRHPEGGYYRETYRSASALGECGLGPGWQGPRPLATSIYFLLAGSDFSALHRIRSDELWHHHAGGALTIHVIDPEGAYRTLALGLDLDRGEAPQAVVPAGSWFGATIADPASYALV